MTSRVHEPGNANLVITAAALIVAMTTIFTGEASAQTPASPPTNPTDNAAPRIPIRIALQTEAAFGVLRGSFHNQLAGARVDLRFSPRVSFGGYLGYVNLKGKDGRAHAVLPYAQIEYMAGDPSSRVRIPLRFASGYLPNNGPVVRVATGLAFTLGPNVDLITEVLAPMVWLTNNQTLLSMNLSLELVFRL